MKLLAHTNLYYIFFSVITYVITAGAFYLVVEYVIYQEVEDRLRVERRDFENYVRVNGSWEESDYFVENKIELTDVTDTLTRIQSFKDTLLYNRYSGESVPFREHSFYISMKDDLYKVSIRKSLIESYKLMKFITGTMLAFLSIALLLLFLFQNRISQTIWKPFYQTLSRAKSFDLKDGGGLTLSREDIYEFNELNSVLEKMTEKIARDYHNLKEFTENAAHEIQTPLALISSRVEELIQQRNFSEDQMYWIQEIHQSTLRLSKLHQALLLLSKIENGQFFENESIDIAVLVRKKMTEFEEIFIHRNLTTSITENGPFLIAMNPSLADVLITNLINNAVKHNIVEGTISVIIEQNQLEVCNTGAALTIDPERLFDRFKKQNQSSGSLGLGLAIVKKISENYGLTISYTYQADQRMHRIILKKNPTNTQAG